MAASKKKPDPYEISVVGSFMSPSTVEQAAAWIEVSDIDFAHKQPRRYFSPEKLEHLTNSVRAKGVLEPILVRLKDDDRYEVVAGERRLRASQEAGLEKIPCVIKELTDSEAFEIAIIENLQRDDLNPVEETEAILDLLSIKLGESRNSVISYFNLAAKQERTGKEVDSHELREISSFFETIGRFTPNSFRTNRLPLLKLPSDVFDVIAKGEIEYSKGRLIARVKDKSLRRSLLEEAVGSGLSRKDILDRIKPSKTKSKNPTSAAKVVSYMGSIFKQAEKSKILNDTSKRKQLEHYLAEIEKLMAEG